MLAKKKAQCGWIVYRPGTDKHTHVESKETAATLIKLIKSGIMPKSKYLIESARRITTPEEFAKLKEKQTYTNRPRSLRRSNR